MLPAMSDATRETVKVLQAVANVKKTVGPKGIGAYCISMAQSLPWSSLHSWFSSQVVAILINAPQWACGSNPQYIF
eukprot:5001418-Pyramimonas_sp.AAC.2